MQDKFLCEILLAKVISYQLYFLGYRIVFRYFNNPPYYPNTHESTYDTPESLHTGENLNIGPREDGMKCSYHKPYQDCNGGIFVMFQKPMEEFRKSEQSYDYSSDKDEDFSGDFIEHRKYLSWMDCFFDEIYLYGNQSQNILIFS